jgi:hypothetical protein
MRIDGGGEGDGRKEDAENRLGQCHANEGMKEMLFGEFQSQYLKLNFNTRAILLFSFSFLFREVGIN